MRPGHVVVHVIFQPVADVTEKVIITLVEGVVVVLVLCLGSFTEVNYSADLGFIDLLRG